MKNLLVLVLFILAWNLIAMDSSVRDHLKMVMKEYQEKVDAENTLDQTQMDSTRLVQKTAKQILKGHGVEGQLRLKYTDSTSDAIRKQFESRDGETGGWDFEGELDAFSMERVQIKEALNLYMEECLKDNEIFDTDNKEKVFNSCLKDTEDIISEV